MVSETIDLASAAILLRSVSSPARLGILLHLLNGEQSVTELERKLGLKQPNLSQHLAELRNARLLVARRQAKSVFYKLADEDARRMARGLLRSFGGDEAAPEPAPTPHSQSNQAAVFAKIIA